MLRKHRLDRPRLVNKRCEIDRTIYHYHADPLMSEEWVESTYYGNTEVSDLETYGVPRTRLLVTTRCGIRNRATTAEPTVTLHPIGAKTPLGAKAWRTVPLRRIVWEAFHDESFRAASSSSP